MINEEKSKIKHLNSRLTFLWSLAIFAFGLSVCFTSIYNTIKHHSSPKTSQLTSSPYFVNLVL
jgi:hypothetical protein